jgi:hypothetical protein
MRAVDSSSRSFRSSTLILSIFVMSVSSPVGYRVYGSYALPRKPAVPPLPTTLDSCSGRGIMTNGSIGTVGGIILMTFEPSVGKSFGLGGSSWPDGDTLSVV